MKHCFFLLCGLLLILPAQNLSAKIKIYSLKSPDAALEAQIVVDQQITYTLLRGEQCLIAPSELSMTLAGGRVWGPGAVLKSQRTQHFTDIVPSPFSRQDKFVAEYNQAEFVFADGFGIRFRLYNEGFAYAFFSVKKEDLVIVGEQAQFNFDKDYTAYIPYTSAKKPPLFATSFESRYTIAPLSEFNKESIAFSPLLVCLDSGVKLEITESGIESYPGMFLKGTYGVDHYGDSFGLAGVFAGLPNQIYVHPTRCQEMVTDYSDTLAITAGPRSFPWRVAAVSTDDTQLPVNNIVYALAPASRIENPSWIKPGKVAWDWWNNWGISGVDFKVGINTQTYKYYIDFAASKGIEYIILDEGWSPPKEGNMFSVIPEIDLKELVAYGASKNVDLILWCVAFALDKDLEESCRHYSEMGIKGFKVDFINRDDQKAVDLVNRISEVAARYQMLVDFHGMYKPAGMQRTWPNVINYEGVWGLEQMKWSTEDMIEYDVTFPYIRMLSGPVDYTQGAMRNAIKADYKPMYSNPSSQGTRAHQVASYIVFDSPLVMLCDNPTAYMKEEETTDFIVDIPVVWDQTIIPSGVLGQYIVTARRSGDEWYIGGMNNWDERSLKLDLSFIGKDRKLQIFKDGPNASRQATDYKIEDIILPQDGILEISMAPGGGFAIIVK